jgi:cytochrome c oxidase cbb3-type subunit 3
MPAFGRDGLLTAAEIGDVTDYVLKLGGTEHDAGAAARGATLFEINCVSCHMADGRGDRTQGAPNLTDADWLYGGDRASIEKSIYRGPFGVMPPWQGRLSDATITALAVYVHTLGGGEATATGS